MGSSFTTGNDDLDRPVIEPSSVGQFVALDGCPQYHKFEFDSAVARTRRQQKAWKEAFEPLSILLAKDGREFEERVVKQIETIAYSVISHEHIEKWEESCSAIKHVCSTVAALPQGEGPFIVTQARLGMEIGVWPIVGDADILALWATEDGVRIRILEVKAAREEKSFHQIQVAVYTQLCRQFLNEWEPSFTWMLEGGVIHRDTEIADPSPSAFPSFSVSQREADIRRLLQAGGRFDTLWKKAPEDIRYQLAPKCYTCAYKEACFTNAIEEEKTALLGLSQGEQERLANHGIETLHDLAELAYPPTDPRPYNYTELTATDREQYRSLLNEPGIGERLPQYIQQAQALLSELDPGSMYTPNTDRQAPWLLGSGQGELPADDPPFDADLAIDRGTLIRTYVHVEWDHRRDRLVMLSAYVTASHQDASAQTVAELIETMPDDNRPADRIEGELLTDFFQALFDVIQTIADDMGQGGTAPIHLYFYTRAERDALVDATKRHPDQRLSPSIRDLLGLRGAIDHQDVDQAMVSIIQSEVDSRIALPIPNRGLLPIKEYFRPAEDFFPRTEWTYTRADGTTIDLRKAFNYKLFDFSVPYTQTETGIHLYPDDEPDGFYPSRARQGSHIPLEYIWAALGKLSPEWISDIADEYPHAESIDPFRWLDRESRTTRITTEDLKALGTRLAQCIAHIERGINYRNPDIPKQPLAIDELGDFSLGESSFPRACTEYLQLEHSANRSDLLAHYSLPVRQRVREGQSIPIVVTDAWVNDNGDLEIEARLLYDQMFDDGDRVAGACRQKGGEGATGGSWMVANRITRQGDPAESANPLAIERGPGVTIEHIDIENREIRLSAISAYRQRDRDFIRRHRDWTTDQAKADEETVFFGKNELFILDPRSDDLTAQRASDLLAAANNNYLCELLAGFATGERSNPTVNSISSQAVEDFLSWASTVGDPSPNLAQHEFIRETTAQCVMLQGPPGTGKTAGALAWAALARVYAQAVTDDQYAGLLTGESNKAVDELLEAVADLQATFQDSSATNGELADVQLVRLTGETPADPHPNVDYVNYHTDRDQTKAIVSALRPQSSELDSEASPDDLSDTATQAPSAVLVFATPSRIYGLVNKFDLDLDTTLSPRDWLQKDASCFDLLVVDEASMMRLPSFTIVGAFVHRDAQLLIGGDQRQLPPVRHHDWEQEDRRPVMEYAPFLSTLDYLRALNGAPVRELPDETIFTGTADCPFYQLERTYRCHYRLADFLQSHVYAADGISYRSNEADLLAEPTPSNEAVSQILDPAAPLALVVHRDRESQQSNPIEAAICNALIDAVNPADDTGIVTPHNAQRGLLTTIVPAGTEVETVERYQGGERDCIIVSATASDPDFLSAEQDFILNPNRLNVAMSRMKRKLVVIASETVFDLIPPDVEKYDQAGLWKALYEDLGVLTQDPTWVGTLVELIDEQPATISPDWDTDIAVYTLRVD